ncbi:unnamed protein product [Gongylonema pulchrum]|uniref:Tafazzin family protein n=1 Tax=Gongylonema pulchrum TaxID=637853 RepID=A0A3P7NQH2_9BILA|nr:unnamed protein product [Gongylonema pulchrum]
MNIAITICRRTQFLNFRFFSLGKCVPIVRGEGVYQKGVDFCIEKLAENQWIHVFPEGKVTPNPIRIKWGVARMIMESPNPPIVLPIWIQRMAEVWPQSKPYYPRFEKVVNVCAFHGYSTCCLLIKTDLRITNTIAIFP